MIQDITGGFIVNYVQGAHKENTYIDVIAARNPSGPVASCFYCPRTVQTETEG